MGLRLQILILYICEYPATPEIPEYSHMWRLKKELQVPQEFPKNSKRAVPEYQLK